MRAIVSSFLLVAISEMGDKTQLLALSLAARFRRPWVVMAGILIFGMAVVAVSVGGLALAVFVAAALFVIAWHRTRPGRR